MPVTGNLTLKASIEPLRMNYRIGNKPPVIEQIYPIVSIYYFEIKDNY